MTSTLNGPPDSGRPAATHHSGEPSQSGQQGSPSTEPTGHNSTRYRLASQQVSWWAVHEFVIQVLRRSESWPLAGTPAWCALADDDPVKLASLLDAAQHWALRLETCQEASVASSHDISTAANWAAIGQRIQARREWMVAHPWAARRVSA